MVSYIIKRDGSQAEFSRSKIKNAISKAMKSSGYNDEKAESESERLTGEVDKILRSRGEKVGVEEIQDIVEKVLMGAGDKDILARLEKNSRKPFLSIAKEIGVSEGTVRKRVKEMLEEGAIKRFTILRGSKEGVKAFVLVKTSRLTKEIAKKSGSLESVNNVYEISGAFDVIVYLEASTVESINKDVDKIREMEGVVSTTTHFVLK